MGIESLLERLLINLIHVDGPFFRAPGQAPRGIHDFSASSVTQGDGQNQPIQVHGFLFRCTHPLQCRRRQGIDSADRSESNSLLDEA